MGEETRVAARVPKELLEKAKRAAKKKDITLSQAIRKLLRELAEDDPLDSENRKEVMPNEKNVDGNSEKGEE